MVVQTVRYALLKHEHRDSTAIKIHEERVLEREHERDAGVVGYRLAFPMSFTPCHNALQ